MITIHIAQDFTITPGGRYKAEGPFSGEQFRESFLEPHFEDRANESEVTVVFDGTEGYATSFLEEAFGGLARDHGKEICCRRLKFVSEEDPLLVEEVNYYIETCEGE